MNEAVNGAGPVTDPGLDIDDTAATVNDYAYAEQYDTDGDTEVVGTFD